MDVFTLQTESHLRAQGCGQQKLPLLLTSLTALHRIICFRGKAAGKSPYLASAPVQPSHRISLDSIRLMMGTRQPRWHGLYNRQLLTIVACVLLHSAQVRAPGRP